MWRKLQRFGFILGTISTIYWFYAFFSYTFYKGSGLATNFPLYIFPFATSWSNSMFSTYQLLNFVGTVMMLSWIGWGILKLINQD